jgi:DHA2 family multidrug resistance protein
MDKPSKAADNGTVLTGSAWVLALLVLAGANFMAVLDINIVNVALPYMAGGLAVSADEATWVITSYAVAEAIIVPLTGWLTLRFGVVRIFVIAIAGFGIVSFVAGLSTTMPMLIALRLMQGMFGAPLMPLSQTLLLRVSPPEKANSAMGLWSMTTIAAPVAGPFLGGIIADSIGWRWVFYINVPIAVVCVLLAARSLRRQQSEIVRNPIDYVGLGLLIVWVGALQLMLDNGQKLDWFGSGYIITAAVVAVIAFLSFLIWEYTEEHPIVDIRVFRYRTFSVTVLVMFFTIGSFASGLLITPLWLQTNMGYTATSAGKMAAMTGVLSVFAAPLAAGLMQKLDVRAMICLALLGLAATNFWRTFFDQDMTFWQIAPSQLVTGGLLMFAFVPLMGLPVASVPPHETASAAGLSNFARTVATAVAVAIATTNWTDDTIRTTAQLTDTLSPSQSISALKADGLTSQQSLQALSDNVRSQGEMLATNHFFGLLGCVMLLAACIVWLMPKPTGPTEMPVGAH